MVVCVLGPKYGGKTLLLKRLQENNFYSLTNFTSLSQTVQTNGTNLLRLIKKSTDQSDEQIFTVQEIGGEIISLAVDFIAKSTKIIYVLDASNLDQLSFNFKHIMQILTSNRIKNKPFLIVFNKTDLQSTISIDELEEMLLLDRLKNEFPFNSLRILQSSCLTGRGLKEIYDFIVNY